MREILFRGKRIDLSDKKGEWIEGLLCYNIYHQICIQPFRNGTVCVVDPETIGQYTGLTDKNGKKIFEGDIVKMTFEGTSTTYDEDGRSVEYDFYGHKIGVVSFGGNGTFLNTKYGELSVDAEKVEGWTPSRRSRIASYRSEVIGNIHDNPELLKGGE